MFKVLILVNNKVFKTRFENYFKPYINIMVFYRFEVLKTTICKLFLKLLFIYKCIQ